MKEFTPEELAQCNGENGKPVYIAHAGKVYDVSASKLWKTGAHMKRHPSGRDLSTDIQAAPHTAEVLQRFPQVGTLAATPETEDPRLPAPLATLLRTFPFLRRHPHPMTVHFPIVFMFSTTVFSLLYLLTGEKSFDTTAFHCLGAGVFFNGVGIATGLYTWWLNYMAKPLKPVRIKIPLTITMLAVSIVLFIWRLEVPNILDALSGDGLLYILLVLSLSVMVTVIGWNGAAMTFPVEKE
ncbi:MAG: cytochrome b5 [Desulfobacteraceae bacterium]|nr:MAG: cytochrome b5 [Desulfobacteraceae bacterium]